MKKRTTRLSRLLLLASVLSGANAAAVPLAFTDPAAWAVALGSNMMLTVDAFDTPRANADVITFDSGVISSGVNPQADARNLVNNGQYNATVNRDGINGYETITWTFPFAVHGFRADFFTTNTLDGTTVSILGTTFVFGDLLGIPGDGFAGFISDAPFTAITFSTDGGSGNEFFVVDNLAFGVRITEPATTALLLLATVALGATRRRPDPF